MPENMIKVVQLKDPTTKEPVSPVVGISSIYDNNGNNIGEQFTNPGLPVRDIRSFPIRTGESISAGDVVNVGRDIISVTTFGDLDVGSIVQIDENGSPVNYIVVNQGIPANDSRQYDSSCDGTWLLRQDIAEQRVWDAGNSNQYANSDINTYLNGDWMNRYDSTTLGNIKTAKIPYCVGGGLSTVNSGANGLSVRAFLLGCFEVGWDRLDSRYFPIDGRLLSYFEDGRGSSANQKRIANLNGSATRWWLRSPSTGDAYYVWSVLSSGDYGHGDASVSWGVRPCIIFDSSTVIDDGETIYGPETVFKNMSDSQNISSHAIALESGTGGETIKLGYGGYCECPGVAAGDEIIGSGEDAVSAIAPKPGWLWINPAHIYDNTVREPIDVPTVSGTLTYNSQAQSPTWNGYDAGKMTIGGNTSATNAGEYTATFTPKEGYRWSDGTLETKSVQWNIGKATPTLSLNPTSLSLVGPTPKTSTITYNGDGVLSAQSNSSSIATASISGTTLSVTVARTGSTTITVTAAAGTNYNSASATLSVSAIYAVSFATDSWETIAAVSEAGVASQVYELGDTKDITLSGIGTMTLEIADFDHDYLSGSTSAQKAGISMITRDLLPSKRAMNNTATNVGGFPASDLCDYLNGTILNGLPSDLRSVLKTIYKWYGTGNNTSNGLWRGFKIWVPLEYELFGLSNWAPDTEHTTGNARKYPIFTDDASRSKRLNNGSGSKTWYWEASPMDRNSIRFCGVYGIEGGATPGGHSAQDANDANGVCFGLCV